MWCEIISLTFQDTGSLNNDTIVALFGMDKAEENEGIFKSFLTGLSDSMLKSASMEAKLLYVRRFYI